MLRGQRSVRLSRNVARVEYIHNKCDLKRSNSDDVIKLKLILKKGINTYLARYKKRWRPWLKTNETGPFYPTNTSTFLHWDGRL